MSSGFHFEIFQDFVLSKDVKVSDQSELEKIECFSSQSEITETLEVAGQGHELQNGCVFG